MVFVIATQADSYLQLRSSQVTLDNMLLPVTFPSFSQILWKIFRKQRYVKSSQKISQLSEIDLLSRVEIWVFELTLANFSGPESI